MIEKDVRDSLETLEKLTTVAIGATKEGNLEDAGRFQAIAVMLIRSLLGKHPCPGSPHLN